MPVARLDTAFRVETPEGIELELQPAGLHARACAWSLDLLLRGGVVYVAAIVAGLLGAIGMSFWMIMVFLIEWFYPVAFELSPMGATPGKRILGLRVVMGNGLPITPAASFTRNLLRAADFLPFMYAFGAVCVLVRSDFRRLGDLVADTLVIHAPAAARHAGLKGISPEPPARPLNREAQSVLVRLDARAGRITPERLDEIAILAAPACLPDVQLAGAEAGPRLTRRVLGVARWILGDRPA